MPKCWASGLGDCSDKQSREHYISKGLFDNDLIIVSGFDWLQGEAKTFNLSTLTANILCTRHNTSLSEVDSEAQRIFRMLGNCRELQSKRAGMGYRSHWSKEKFVANGIRFERWAAKTTINIFCIAAKDRLWQMSNTSPNNPPLEIVRAIYGNERLEAPLGIYDLQVVGTKTTFPDAIGLETLSREGKLYGAILYFKEVRFLVWLSREPIESGSIMNDGQTWGFDGVMPMRHPRGLDFTVGGSLSHKLRFQWFRAS